MEGAGKVTGTALPGGQESHPNRRKAQASSLGVSGSPGVSPAVRSPFSFLDLPWEGAEGALQATFQDFRSLGTSLAGPVVKTLHFHCRRHELDP